MEWVKETRKGRGGPKRRAAAEASARTRFAAWILTKSGGEWFDRWLTEVGRDAGSPAADWWRVLRANGWCRAYPDLNLDAPMPTLEWPSDTPRLWPAVSYVPSDIPIEQIVEVRGYSPVPNAARVILSDGRPSLGSLLARFHELYSAVGEANALWWANSRHDEARTLSLGFFSRDREARGFDRPLA